MTRVHALLFFVLAIGFATAVATHAGEAVDLDAEAKQAAEEDAAQKAERAQGQTGKYQRTFYGTFQWVGAADGSAQQLSPEVVGNFSTNSSDRKPGRTYLVKVENANKGVIETLKKFNGKITEVQGKLRNLTPEGEAKYLIVTSVVEVAPTRPATERRKFGGL